MLWSFVYPAPAAATSAVSTRRSSDARRAHSSAAAKRLDESVGASGDAASLARQLAGGAGPISTGGRGARRSIVGRQALVVRLARENPCGGNKLPPLLLPRRGNSRQALGCKRGKIRDISSGPFKGRRSDE